MIPSRDIVTGEEKRHSPGNVTPVRGGPSFSENE